ncbi:MAG: tRNA (adenosine(37)-N6)-dimethylallyltransferase MiaA [Anaerolineae bacterium]
MTSSADKLPLVAIVGPTAVGKTALAIRLADDLPVEVVSADSRQVYRYMDIGTAKPTIEERQRVRHHLLDIVDPDEAFTLAQYQQLAYAAIDDIQRRRRIPLLVGGTGLYVKAVLEGLSIPRVPPDQRLREQLCAEAAAKGYEELHRRLSELDPVAAERIDARNVRRVVRALEVCYLMGKPISSVQEVRPPPYSILSIGLTMPRSLLYQRIDERVERMVAAGVVEEVRSLVARGYSYDLPSMSGLGYRQIGMYLRGEVSLEEAVALIKRHTRRFVRHQANWFREDDPTIVWFNAAEDISEAVLRKIKAFLGLT